ncbi:MAG: DMT family transporter [Acidobacteriota bacterium]|nr:DMT family transporter [Blastocatellia bacterium]MDW8240348.1 DMT family transporter [Acidobacteriota bacterium]
MRPERKGEVLLLLVALIWAGTYSVDGAMVRQASPFLYLTIRFLLAGLLFAWLFRHVLRDLTKRVVWHGVLIGFYLYLEFFLQLQGLVYTSPAKMGFITGLFIVITPVLSVALINARITVEQVLGVLLAMTGFAILAFPESGGRFNIGDLMGLGAAVASSLHILYMGVYVRQHDVNQLNLVQIVAAGLFFLVTALIIQGILALSPTVPALLVQEARGIPLTWQFPLSVMYTAVLATVVLFSLQARGQRHVTPTRTVIIFSLSPVFAAIISYLTLGDWIGWRGYAGGLLTVLGVIVSELKLWPRAAAAVRPVADAQTQEGTSSDGAF